MIAPMARVEPDNLQGTWVNLDHKIETAVKGMSSEAVIRAPVVAESVAVVKLRDLQGLSPATLKIALSRAMAPRNLHQGLMSQPPEL